MGIGGDGGIVAVLMDIALVMVVVVISFDFSNCMFCVSVCGVGSHSVGSSLAHQFKHY